MSSTPGVWSGRSPGPPSFSRCSRGSESPIPSDADLPVPAERDPILVRSSSGDLVALVAGRQAWFTAEVDALEEGHPERRFAMMLALVAILMRTGPDAEPYEAAKARFYARYILIPDTAFLLHSAIESDAQLAERFNVPLREIAEKRRDLRAREMDVA